MTAQIADRLINASPDLDLPGYQLFGIFTGEPASEHGTIEPYRFTSKATPDPRMCNTAVARGYISLYRLNSSGRLTLNGFAYLPHNGRAPDLVHEELTGDFWLLLRQSFFGDSIYVPFRDGILASDRSQWRHQASSRDLMKERAAQRELARSATVRVLCAEDALFDLSKFSIYIDGNGHRTPPRLKHLVSPSLETIPVEPGKHRIVIREAEVRKPDRAESNTEHFELASGEEATFALQLDGKALLLKPLQPFVAAP